MRPRSVSNKNLDTPQLVRDGLVVKTLHESEMAW